MILRINLKNIRLLILTEFCVLSTAGSILEYAISIPFILFTALLFCFSFKPNFQFLCNTFATQRNNRVLILFLLWTILSLIINVFFLNAHIIDGILSLVFTYFISFILVYFLGVLLAKYYEPDFFFKLITIALYFIMIFGFIEYIMFVCHIPGLDSILYMTSGNIGAIWYKKGLFPRIQSVFQEPSHYAWFLICNIPFIFKISEFKYKLFKNKYLNYFSKKLLKPCFFLSLIMTQSAINLIFAIIFIAIYKFKTLPLRKIILFFICFVILCIPFAIYCTMADIRETYLYRIIVTIGCFGDFSSLVMSEPSLATRLISYANMILIFLKNIFFGIGCGQIKYLFYQNLAQSSLPLTVELATKINQDLASVNPAIFYKILVDTGFLGIIFITTFFYYLLKKIRFAIKHSVGIFQDYFITIKYVIYIYIVLMFYDSQLTCHYFWLLFGAASGFYFNTLITLSKKENNYA